MCASACASACAICAPFKSSSSSRSRKLTSTKQTFTKHSGNQLVHLDGKLLLDLPQLFSLQLGGPTNRWRCDCRLRKLVRLLLHKLDSPNANILQDEPQCALLDETQTRRRSSSLASNMHNSTLESTRLANVIEDDHDDDDDDDDIRLATPRRDEDDSSEPTHRRPWTNMSK